MHQSEDLGRDVTVTSKRVTKDLTQGIPNVKMDEKTKRNHSKQGKRYSQDVENGS